MIIPAILTDNRRVAQERLNQAQQMSGWVHIDILDETLYKFCSLALDELETLDFHDLAIETHCMINDVSSVTQSKLDISRLILHSEAPHWETQYNHLVERGINTWIAIDPSTDVEKIKLPHDTSGIVLMGVIPGQMGQQLLPKTADRLDTLKELYPDIPVTIDGGVTGDNLAKIIAHGADNAVMGSAIYNQSNPLEAYEKYVALADPAAHHFEHNDNRT